MKRYNVAILGATGAVGREMLKVLEEIDFPLASLTLLASKNSVGKSLFYKGKQIKVREATHDAFKGIDIVLGASGNAVAKEFARDIVGSGALFIDNSSAFRMDKDVPLVIPEINPFDIKGHHGIISNPNCSTIITLLAVYPLFRLSPIKAMIASTYQAVSGAGAKGPIELEREMKEEIEGKEHVPEVFLYPIVSNLIPHIGSFDEEGYTSEENKMQNEGRKILHCPELKVTCTCVRVPVKRSHCISVTVLTEKPLSLEEVREAMESQEGLRLYDDISKNEYPMPLITSDQDLVYVGRIRKDRVFDNGISLWCSGDQVRKGAATNAVMIAMKWVEINA
ncbi:MAG: aspartate-semialdehyde dehydrogenase [Bacilli bacterium]|nr:aspartate-semialdehyde dehydrogenase [Bacilli bacterium]